MTKQAELSELYAIRAKILNAIKGSLDSADVESYSFGEADGSQSLKHRSPKELQDMLNVNKKQIELLEAELRGGGVRVFSTNRYS